MSALGLLLSTRYDHTRESRFALSMATMVQRQAQDLALELVSSAMHSRIARHTSTVPRMRLVSDR